MTKTIHCSTWAAVDNWIERLFKAKRCNYFVRYLDVKGPSLMYGNAAWVLPGAIYIDR